MASRKEYEMMFQLGAQLGASYNNTFGKAREQIALMQQEIQALSRTQSDISAYQKQQQAVESTKQKLSVLQQQYDNIQKEIKETESYSSSLQNKLLAKQQQIDKTSASLSQQTEKLGQMGTALKNAGIDTNNLTKESSALTVKIDDLKKSQEAAATEALNFGNKSVGAFEALGTAITTAGIEAALKRITDEYVECIKIAADFEETMSTVEALSGASEDEMNQLGAFAKELGATTKFTAIESGEAMTYMGMAGWKASQMLEGMDGVLQLAAASGEDLAMVSDIVTDNLTAFGLKASDTAHFSDVLAAAATNSNTSVSIMGETFKMSASVAGALGYTIEDVAVAVGLMANSGIKGSVAGTALKNTFNGLLEGVTLTSKAFGEYDYTAVNADGTMKSFSSTINELRTYFEQMTEAERVNNAMAIAGQRGYNGLLAILNATDNDYKSLTQSINECSGAAAKMATIKLDNLNGQMTLAKSAADALKTTLGEQFKPELQAIFKIGTELLGGINTFISEHPIVTKAIIAITTECLAFLAAYSAYTAIKKAKNALSAIGVVLETKEAAAATANAAATTAQATATTAATVAQNGLNTAMNANPLLLAFAGIAAVTTAVIAFSEASKKSKEETVKLTATSEAQREEIEQLREEYDKLCAAGEGASEQAVYLEYRISNLTETFEAQKQTLEEYISECEELNKAWQERTDSNIESVESTEKNSTQTLALVHRLQELASQTHQTVGSQQEMITIIDELNSRLPGVGLKYDDAKNGLGEWSEAAEKAAQAKANLEKAESARQSMMDEYGVKAEAEQRLADLREKERLELETLTKAKAKYDKEYATINGDVSGLIHFKEKLDASRSLNDSKEAYEASEAALESYRTEIANVEDSVKGSNDAIEQFRDVILETSGISVDSISGMAELGDAIAMTSLEMQNLSAAYDESYVKAESYFQEQFGLFDEAKADADATVANAQKALDSQLAFWQNYSSDISVLRETSYEDLGISKENYDAIMSYAQSGTEEAAGFASSLANAIKSNNTDVVKHLMDTFGKVEEARNNSVSQVVDWQLDIDGETKKIIETLTNAVDEMDMSKAAAENGRKTIQGLIDSASSMKSSVYTAYSEVAQAAIDAINRKPITVSSPTSSGKPTRETTKNFTLPTSLPTDLFGINRYAKGTSGAEPGAAWVGENGPEIVIFDGGEQVIPSEESKLMMRYLGRENKALNAYAAGTDIFSSAQPVEPISAYGMADREVNIRIYPPQFVVNGSTSDNDVEKKIYEYADIIVEKVIDALDEANVDVKRGAYI